MPVDQLYSVRRYADHIWTCRCQVSKSLKEQQGSVFFLKTSHHQNLHCKLWSPAGLCTNIRCGQLKQEEELMLCVNLSVKQANESCENCHFSLHFWHESVPRWGRQNPDSTGNQFLSQIITISSDGEELVLCVTVKFMTDDKLVANCSLKQVWFHSGMDIPANETFDLHDCVFVDPGRMFQKALVKHFLLQKRKKLYKNV